ncbi:unnamed protein product [Heterobilharzia americana]|nr:unnamed protein product [Heterobilharzia americana]CAH8513432.1 unnamed protein product [Heterobilharzia americana]
MIEYIPLLMIFSTLYGSKCQNHQSNITKYISEHYMENNTIMINGILMGIGLFIGILTVTVLFIYCCKPDSLNNSLSRIKVLHSNYDDANIWSANFEIEEIQEDNQMKSFSDTEYTTEDVTMNISTVDISSLLDDNSMVNLNKHISYDSNLQDTSHQCKKGMID